MKKYLGLLALVIMIMNAGCMQAKPPEVAASPEQNTVPVSTPQETAKEAVKQPVSTNVESAFTKAEQHPEKILIDVINSAKETLDVAIHSITHPDIVAAIRDAKKRGVAVRVITDKTQSEGKTQGEALKILGSAGIPMKINSHSGLMHLKVTIADKKVVTTGSYNYSKAASTTNDEVLVVIREEGAAKTFSDEFEKMWNDTKGFKTIEKKIAKK
ncbi:phospholipase D family nuclease [Paenibacillus tyrfis]|uniref:phospholipase D family nuclease n=1 Tax=Paenibacillus tyrfis TaxID=1501230 RepID=UPI0020A1DF3B|nr:phospholipase D family protein [Paenibacillus tyrfis]MCP1305945.1 phospholipase D family protein [Paenibacillus tyrfis]